jgi:hypothetical protein
VEHDLFGKPDPTFPDRALTPAARGVIEQAEMRTELPPHPRHCRAGGEGVRGNTRQRTDL